MPFIHAAFEAGARPSMVFRTGDSKCGVEYSLHALFDLLEFLHAVQITRLEGLERVDLIADK